ncbi:MAG: ABC transporter substrate-binding protein [Candidatus Omnitrophota bacterium]
MKKHFYKIGFLIFAFFLFWGWRLTPGVAQEKANIVVLNSRVILQYNQALSGFKQELKDNNVPAFYREYDLSRIPEAEFGQILQEINKSAPDSIIALGTKAAVFAKENIPGIPIIFFMVLNPEESGIISGGRNKNITGVALNIPIAEQFKYIKKFLPEVKKIGMLYQSEVKTLMAEEAQAAAGQYGFELQAVPVNNSAQVMPNLEMVLKESECLWGGVDPLIFNPNTTQKILLATLRNKCPFMAFSSAYVKGGALFALESDYNDIGRQAAQMAIKILGGQNIESISVEFPRKTLLSVNQKTAKTIQVELSETVFDEADIVY